MAFTSHFTSKYDVFLTETGSFTGGRNVGQAVGQVV